MKKKFYIDLFVVVVNGFLCGCIVSYAFLTYPTGLYPGILYHIIYPAILNFIMLEILYFKTKKHHIFFFISFGSIFIAALFILYVLVGGCAGFYDKNPSWLTGIDLS